MSEKYLAAIVGSKETILGFKALGLKTFNANSIEEAIKILHMLKAETAPAYAIIFIMEDLMKKIPRDDYKHLCESALPAIIPVPSSKGTTGYGIKRIGKMVEQAVGSDIFSN